MDMEQRMEKRLRPVRCATVLVNKRSPSRDSIWQHLAKPAVVSELCFRRARSATLAEESVVCASTSLSMFTFLQV